MAYNPAASITTVVGLTDTPANFTGDGLKTVRVNTGETALEFVTRYKDTPIAVAVSDEITPITVDTDVVTLRVPAAFTLSGIRASLSTASTSGTVTVDVHLNGTTIMSTNKLRFDAGEKTTATYSGTAATLTTTAIADDDEITIDIDDAGSSSDAAGLKVYLLGTWD